MNQLYKGLLAILIVSCVTLTASAQQDYWSARSQGSVVSTDKAVARQSFPKEFKVLALDIAPLRQQLFSIVDRSASRSTVITLPDANGGFEKFRVYEASNFEPALQAKYPEIRAYSGTSLTDPGSTLKLSISPQGIQTMVFRTNGRPNEYIEPYSSDHTVYAVFKSQRQKGGLPWICSTVDQEMAQGLNNRVYSSNVTESSAGELKTMRLAQSCNGEYANWFGATSVAQEALVLAAFNATMTRTNGCYEKDLAVHLNLIANTTQVIYYNPVTDPYTTLPNWNLQLQQTLTNIIGNPNYDIGHMFGASGGGGNAGCIGCVCVDPPTPNSLAKGAGITSPADGIPQGDNFDIDYVAHEVGHQLGGNHTFSFSNEGTGSNKEVGSGITIMGYAGITSYDVAPHSIDIFHERSIEQIQNNLATKTCPVTTPLAGVNATPVIAPLANYTIPISTPFVLTGSATDADGDPITYCWEQNDAGGAGSTGASSVAFPTKPNGPNWLSFSPTTSPSRLCPRLSTILAGLNVTPPLPGGDAIANIEALSSISRALNFRLTVRDNHPYSSTPPLAVGQTSFMDMTVTVTNTAGPFEITSPNTPVSWAGGSTQTVTWSVNNTNTAPVNVATVNILLSTDGGQTFPTVLATATANDGTETITIPNSPTSTARIKVEAVGNIFFDINNANLTITVPPNGFTFTTPPPAVSACPAGPSMSITLGVVQVGTFNGPVNMTASGNPPGTTVSIVPNNITPGNTTVVTLNGTNTLSFGSYTITITGTSAGFPNATRDLVYTINPGAAPVITAQPVNQTVCANNPANFSVTATGATSYQWQVSTIAVPAFNNIAGATAATYNIPTATTGMTGNQYRVIVSSQCGTVTSNAATLTVNIAPAISTHPQNATICTGNNNTFSVTATGTSLTYQWELNSGSGYNPIAGATSASYTVNNATLAMNGYSYRVVISGACPPSVTSNAATLTVAQAPAITSQPVDASVCVPPNATTGFAVTATGATTYAWEMSTSGAGGPWIPVTNGGIYSGATTSSLVLTGVSITMNGYRYRALVSNASCPAVISNSALLTVNEIPSISGQPQNATICAGSNNTFSVSAAGSGLSYQWQVSTIAIPGFTNIPGANASSYTVNAATVGMNGNQYRVVINGACPPAITSAPAVLNVVAPPAITTQPANDAVCETGNISFSVVATGTTQYQWQVSTNGGSSWTDIAGATTSTLSLTNVSTTMDGYMYRVQLRNGTCLSPVSSNPATLTVNNRPTVTIAASPYTALLPGRQTTITATLVPASTAFNITWKRNNVVIPGATTNTYIANVTKLGNYQVEILDPITGCNNTSNILTIRDSASTKLFVFPSPNNGRFTVSYHNPPGTPTSQTLAIYDSKGQKVYHRKLNVNGPYELHDIDLTTSTGGIYYVVLGDQTGKVLADAKVLIAH
jgi:hypothetical protein